MKQIEYTLTVTVTQQIEEYPDETFNPEDYGTRIDRRTLERNILRALTDKLSPRHIDGKVDVECIEHEIKESGTP